MGRLLSTNVAVGDSVRQGDVLAAIEANALTLSARSARADWRAAQVQLENISATMRGSSNCWIAASLRKARSI